MVIKRGEIWWAELPEPAGSEPGYRLPLLILQSDDFNKSKINTTIAVTLTTNLNLSSAPGNIFLSKRESKLPRESVINISQIVTIDKSFLMKKVSTVSEKIMSEVETGLRLVLRL